MGERNLASEIIRPFKGGVSIPLHEGAVWFQEDGLQRDCLEPEPGVCAVGHLESVRMCQSGAKFSAIDGIGMSKYPKTEQKED